MIRHCEKIGFIPPPPLRGAGYRDYDERDLHRLRFIANARDLGFPIEEIRTLLVLGRIRVARVASASGLSWP